MSNRFMLDGKNECGKCADLLGAWLTNNPKIPDTFAFDEFGDYMKNAPSTLGCTECINDPCSICKQSKMMLEGI